MDGLGDRLPSTLLHYTKLCMNVITVQPHFIGSFHDHFLLNVHYYFIFDYVVILIVLLSAFSSFLFFCSESLRGQLDPPVFMILKSDIHQVTLKQRLRLRLTLTLALMLCGCVHTVLHFTARSSIYRPDSIILEI